MRIATSVRGVSCSLALGLLLAGPLAVRADDLLEKTRQLKEVEAQKMEREVREARRDAYGSLKTQPVKALDRLQTVLALLEKDTALSEERRAALKQQLKKDVYEFEGLVAQRLSPSTRDMSRIAREESRRGADTRREADQKRLQSDAASRINSISGRVADARSSRAEAADRRVAATLDVDRSARLPSSDYELPADWAEKSMKRSTGIKMTEREKAIMKILNTPISVDFKSTPLSEVIDQLQRLTNGAVVIDKQALDEVNATYATPVTMQANKVTTRTVLKKILADLGLAYIIKDESIQVMSIARARETLTTRTYPIADLATAVDVRLGPYLGRLQMIENISTIINNITHTIDPPSWKANNPEAAGTIVFEPITMSLIIKQTAEFHFLMAGK